MSFPRVSTVTALALALVACGPKPQTTPVVAPAPATDADAASEPVVDSARLFGVVEYLASDDLGGRYTLSDDIRRSSTWLSEQLKAAGVAPVGEAYAHEFTLVTGAEPLSPPAFVVSGRGRPTEVASSAFVPASGSASGTLEGEVVFVGYAARALGETDMYDDLAGVDLKGKIALVLAHQPGQPDVRAYWRALRDKRRAYEAAAAPLLAKRDVAGLKKLRTSTVAGILKLSKPWLPKAAPTVDELLGDAAPDAPLDVEGIAAKLSQAQRAREGAPTFAGFGRTSEKVRRVVEAGASAVILVEGPRSYVDAKARTEDELPSLTGDRPLRTTYDVPVVHLKWQQADRLFRVGGKTISALQKKIDTELKPASGATGRTAKLDVKLRQIEHAAPNVLAMIPGTDLANEIVLFGAHYDHVGRDAEGKGDCHGADRESGERDAICNGADDNASGTAVVMELARSLAQAGLKPRRTLVFALFSGEELGLLGSKAMAESLPKAAPFDRGKIVAMVNIDMVGRLREQGLAIGGVGSSDGWMQILDGIGNHGMPILYDKAITTRSDHAAFYELGIPVLFFFTHTHPDYHGPGDESDRINRDGLTRVTELTLDIALRLADGHAIAYAAPKTPDEGLVRALPGDNPKTVVKRVGEDGKPAAALAQGPGAGDSAAP